jgi:transcriptional regulator with XRE-family HTH domain
MNLGFSQVKLSHESKVSLPTIQNIEALKTNPSIEILEKLLTALGVEFKLHAIPFDIDKAILLGVPLTSSTKNKVEILNPSGTLLKQEARKWNYAFQEKTFNEREEIAIISFLLALKDHYPSFYNEEILTPIFENKINSQRSNGKITKLRRISINNLSKYL